LPQIEARAEALKQQLREMEDRLSANPTLIQTTQILRSQEALLVEKRRQLDELIAISPTRSEFQDVEQEWVSQKELYSSLQAKLTERAKEVENDVNFLESQQAVWGATLNQIQDATAIDTVFDRIRSILAEIPNTSSQAKELLGSLLTLQSQVSQQNHVVLDVLKSIAQEKVLLQRGLLEPDEPPLWRATLQEPGEKSIDHIARRTFNRNLERTLEFIRAHRYAILAILLLFPFVLAAFAAIRQRIPVWTKEHPDVAIRTQPFWRPISLSIITILGILIPAMTGMPTQIRLVLFVLSLTPVLRLLAPQIGAEFRPLLYVLVVFVLTAWIWETSVTSPVVKRWGSILLGLTVIAVVVWLMRMLRGTPQVNHGKARLVAFAIYFYLALILASVVADIFGYVGLSLVMRTGTVLSAYSAVVLYTIYLVITASILPLVQARKAAAQSTTAHLRGDFVRWAQRLTRWAAYLIWLFVVLNALTIREPVVNAVTFALTTPIRLRAASFTLADVLTFILILGIGIGLSGLIRLVLSRGVLSRLKLKVGTSYAISTITYYLLLLAVCLLALTAAGIELTKFTVLTGALGVGAGFGLQNVISNFVSGIILLFERPIRIGDFLEIDQAKGEVVRIGMRSSSIRTPQGAEVIVPNSNLISRQVTNWTLAHHDRRSELLVKVAYGADPERVSELLLETAQSHAEVVRQPSPQVFFLGFGDNSLDFELHFWVLQDVLTKKVNSEVAIKLAHEFREAGIEIAAPKRELYLTGIDPSVKEALASHLARQTEAEGKDTVEFREETTPSGSLDVFDPPARR
jgi:small-conductance mechanosensitive channel